MAGYHTHAFLHNGYHCTPAPVHDGYPMHAHIIAREGWHLTRALVRDDSLHARTRAR
jgi:hypothetical protein